MKYLFLLVLAVVAFSCENEENMTIDAPDNLLLALLVAALFSCNGQQNDQKEETEIYSEKIIDESENLEREAEELDKEVEIGP
jgi:hypothetical protein